MMSRLHGDIPQEHLDLEKELDELEIYFNKNKDKFHPADIAKGLVCIAHDRFLIGDDDKGSELLELANKTCPGYFNKEINEDIKADSFYAMLIESLTEQILAVAASIMESAGNKNGRD